MSHTPTIDATIGNTPLVRLQRLPGADNARRGNLILGKLEGNNPGGSVKDRPAYSMIRRAEERGEIKPGDRLIEATSGNTGIALAMVGAAKGYKVILTTAHLGVPLKTIDIDVVSGFTRKPDFLARNPNGRVPTLEFEDGRTLPESNAIIWYLAEGSNLIPEDRFARAQMLQWMFFEQYSHEPYVAVARAWVHVFDLDMTEERLQALEAKRKLGYDALDVMEEHLARNDFFVGGRYTIADIALYAYTHVAGEGGFDLERYSAVRAWISRVAEQPGYVPITQG